MLRVFLCVTEKELVYIYDIYNKKKRSEGCYFCNKVIVIMKKMLKNFNQIKISPVFKRLSEFITEDIDIYLPGGCAYVK